MVEQGFWPLARGPRRVCAIFVAFASIGIRLEAAQDAFELSVFSRAYQDWNMPDGAAEQVQMMMEEQWQEDETRMPKKAKKPVAVRGRVTNHRPGPVWLFKCGHSAAWSLADGWKEEKLGKLNGFGANTTIKAESGDILLIRSGPKEFKDPLLRRWEFSSDTMQHFTLVGNILPKAAHAYFELMNSTVQELEAIAFDPRVPPNDRVVAAAALLQHRPGDEDAGAMHQRLMLVCNIQRTMKWKHYTENFHPFKLFAQSPAAKKAKKASSQGNKKKTISRPSSKLLLFVAEGFLEKEESAALAATAEMLFSQQPAPLVCFNRGEADMRAVLAASKSPDSWGHLTSQDFLPGSNCLGANVSNELLSGSPPALGVPPRTVDGMRAEVSLLETIGKRAEEKFGLLHQTGQDFMWVLYNPGSEYMPHTDCLKYRSGRQLQNHAADPKVDRFATMLISLNDDMKGGETSFPNLNLTFPPKAGRALVWWNINPETGFCDEISTHVAHEVREGRKLILMRWYTYHPPFSVHRGALRVVFDRRPFQPEVSCDVGERSAGSLSCRYYASMTNSGADKGGGNVPLEDVEQEEEL